MPDIEAQVRGYACDAIADCHPDRITQVRRFPTGENHAVYRLCYLGPTGDTEDLVIRVSLGTHADDCLQAEREARVLSTMQGIGAPRLYDFRRASVWFDRPASCLEFVRGEPRDMTLASAADVRALGSAVGYLHALPADDLAAWLPRSVGMAAYLDSRLANIVGRLPYVCDPLPSSVQDRLQHTWLTLQDRLSGARTGDSFAPGEELVLLHADIGAGNILWTPKPVLIDWEYARFGDPADEVAYIFSQNELHEAQRAAFWLGYREHSLSERRLNAVVDRVSWWEPTTLLGSALYWVELFSRRAAAEAAGQDDPATPRTRSYYLERVTLRLDRLDDLLVDPRRRPFSRP